MPSVVNSYRLPGYRLAKLAMVFMLAELVVWLFGLGGRHAHLLLVPFWLLTLVYCLIRFGQLEMGFLAFVKQASDRLARLNPYVFYMILLSVFGLGWLVALACKVVIFAFSSHDLGIYSSIAYNTAHGHLFYSSVQQMNHLGEHFSPIMVLFAPFYWLHPHLGWLLVALLAAYLSVPILIYFVCRRLRIFLPEKRAPVYLIGLLWLLYGPMASAISFAFHPSTLTAPLILLSYYMLERRKWLPFYTILAGLLFFKENLAVVLIGFGLFLASEKKHRYKGIALAAAGSMAAYLIIGVIIPYFRMAPYHHLSRFNPFADLGLKTKYVLMLFSPVLFLPLLRWRYILLFLPAIVLNLSTDYSPQYKMYHHYDDVVSPLIFIALIAILREFKQTRFVDFSKGHRTLALCTLWFLLVVLQLGASPWRIARENWPTAQSRALLTEVQLLKDQLLDEDTMLYVQAHLDLPFQRYRKADLLLCDFDAPSRTAVIVLSRHVRLWPLSSVEEIVQKMESRPKDFIRVGGFDQLIVYRTPPL